MSVASTANKDFENPVTTEAPVLKKKTTHNGCRKTRNGDKSGQSSLTVAALVQRKVKATIVVTGRESVNASFNY